MMKRKEKKRKGGNGGGDERSGVWGSAFGSVRRESV